MFVSHIHRCFHKIWFSVCCVSSANPSLSKENQSQLKEGYSSLMTLLIEAAKNDLDANEVV